MREKRGIAFSKDLSETPLTKEGTMGGAKIAAAGNKMPSVAQREVGDDVSCIVRQKRRTFTRYRISAGGPDIGNRFLVLCREIRSKRGE